MKPEHHYRLGMAQCRRVVQDMIIVSYDVTSTWFTEHDRDFINANYLCRRMKCGLYLLLSLLCCSMTFANGVAPSATQLPAPIDFDGWVTEEEWGEVPLMPYEMQLPSLGGTPSQLTEARLAYDDEYIYFAGRMYDDDMDAMMAKTKRRDALTGVTQFFGIIIDSYNDNENALGFFTTPTGLRWDGAVSNDALGGNAMNISWNAFWDVKVQQDEKGWYAEFRIPFTSLGFEDLDGEVTMGLISFRYIPRTNELNMFPLIPPDFGDWSAWRPSFAKDFKFEGVKRKRPFYVTPYILTGHSSINELSADETSYQNDSELIRSIGGDIKYGLSKSWTLDLSVNTDFAQVEADDQQVNLTRFSLFFPEKRLFFQERSGVFNFNFGRRDQLFYSRRIGITDGEIQNIIGGARVVGRTGAWDLGVISMHTANQNVLDGELLSVVRAKRDVINDRSDVGFLVTHRTNHDGTYNANYGLDATLELIPDHRLSLRYAQTLDSDIENTLFRPDASKYWISFGNQSRRGLSYGASYSQSGIDHLPSMGFEVRDNYRRVGQRVAYNWYQDNDSKVFYHGWQSGGAWHWSLETGKLESLNWRGGWDLYLKNGWGFEVRVQPNIENLVESFELADDVIIPAGDYKFLAYQLRANSPFTGIFNFNTELTRGNFYDGTRNGISLGAGLNLSSSFEVNVNYEYNKANFDARNEELQLHLVRLRTLIMFDTKLSLATLIQYNSQNKTFLGNVRFRYNPQEGHDLFVVYNDDLNNDRFRERPTLPLSNQRSIQIKYSYTFRL